MRNSPLKASHCYGIHSASVDITDQFLGKFYKVMVLCFFLYFTFSFKCRSNVSISSKPEHPLPPLGKPSEELFGMIKDFASERENFAKIRKKDLQESLGGNLLPLFINRNFT